MSKPKWTIETADCVEYMRQLPESSVRLMIADPPYNYGQDYAEYQDDMPPSAYFEWTMQWLTAAQRVLTNDGSLWIFIPDEWVSEIDLFCRRQLKMYKRSHIVWFFSFGQAGQRNFARSHTHILYLTKTKTKFVANDAAIRVPSNRQLVYNDKRAKAGGKLPDNTWVLTKQALEEVFQPDFDTWFHSRICGTFKERERVSPNQLPVDLLKRIVAFASDPGDTVVDPFCGTGSAGLASLLLGRSYLGLELSEIVAAAGRERLRQAEN